MASVHRDTRGKSPFWYAAFYGADGSRKFKSTKATDKKKALQIAVEWEKAAEQARAGKLTAAQARKILSEMVAISTGESLHSYTVEGWLNEWADNKAANTAHGTMVRYRQVIRDFLAALGARAKMPLVGVTPGDIASFRDSLHKSGLTPTTVNNVVKNILSGAFAAAQRLGYIPTNPVAAVDSIKARGEERKAGREPFTLAEVGKLLAHASPEWQGAILLAVTTGLRLGDVARLQWGAVDREAGLLRVDTQKTGRAVTLPIHPDLEAWLAKQARGIGKAPVFRNLATKRVNGVRGLSYDFRAIMEQAKIAHRVIERNGAGRKGNSKSFHSLRHTFVSLLANSGVAADIRQKLAGHADAKVHANYTHHELETLRGAVAKLPSLIAG